ncbi:N-acetylglucosamine-6-phosphate deacetylase [Actinomyces lilanjuaniae]|uniref:N-acetylglucosamine-6-phosphate deacetylase n=1 Tax=Actinomyces lilanjuaniae TaxID=2321394 RepID=A0ABM6Z4C9_9ACTO|nr:amidohydrolase family protein [Actinomyces lilanjuaniae]AYD90176.1 N-acetylglucosamine-6-phosphate deacetylase [Actinomyces lilanjuaniae]
MTCTHVLRGRVVTPERVIDDGLVVTEGSRIAWVGEADRAGSAGYGPALDQAVPAPQGGYLLPGLVDLHCHGGGGASFPDAQTPQQVMVGVMEHRRHGTTSLVASCVTAAPEVLRHRTRLLARLCEDGELAGIHYEGPFLSSRRCGAQDPAFLTEPDADLVRELARLACGHVATMTVAPEKPGVTGTAGVNAALVSAGALPSYGHTDADGDAVRAAVADAVDRISSRRAAGLPVRSRRPTVTHLFNAMPPVHHRHPGPVPAFLAAARRGEVVLELVADGVHLSAELVTELFEVLGRESLVLVTDAMAAAGMADGSYALGPAAVTVSGGIARVTGSSTIAGGTAHLIDVVRTTWRGGVDLTDAVYAASLQGARVLGDPEVGALVAGLRADVVVTDTALRPVRVIRRGREVPGCAG